MRNVNRWVTGASTALAIIAAGLLLAATLIITLMVVLRGAGVQTSWELELSIELMVAAIFLASPYTLATGGHVKMDLLEAILPERINRKLAFMAKVAGCLVCLYLGWEGLLMAQQAFVTGERSLGSWQPLAWPRYATVPIGMFMTALQYLASMQHEYFVRRDAAEAEAKTCLN